MGISPRVNVKMRVDFELASHDVTVSHSVMTTPPDFYEQIVQAFVHSYRNYITNVEDDVENSVL